jgi:protein-S-isoprenylcysteine O-methyltransferase Ste14
VGISGLSRIGPGAAKILRRSAWVFYAVIVLEILFMISPFAVYFYSAYGPLLNLLDRSPWTAWLTQFFLPHISQTRSLLLNALHVLGGPLILAGLALFLAGAGPIYWAKLRRRGTVTGGLYRFIRHPQYVGLAILGLGTLLVWPRFFVLIGYITMCFLYAALARFEEQQCLARFGESYRVYQARTGMFLPRPLSSRIPSMLPAFGLGRAVAAVGVFAVTLALAVLGALALRDYSLSRIATLYDDRVAVLSPALLNQRDLSVAYETALGDGRVRDAVQAAGGAPLIVHVVPESWCLPDLPLETVCRDGRSGGHHTPKDFDRRRYKVLVAQARTHAPRPSGRQIVETAYGLKPIIVAQVDMLARTVTEVAAPPRHVVWGDIPTPIF